ncbi:MAG: hypothetical protein IVW56_04640 [Candidatus Binataceae bacterium]|nr:hypothetical protein [Candidatus Binataceae bacterium]
MRRIAAILIFALSAPHAGAAHAQVLLPEVPAAAKPPAAAAAPAPTHPGGGGFYFTAGQGASEPHVTFHYNSRYACQDWQGGACYLGRRNYLGPLAVCRGAQGIRGGACGLDPGPLVSQWSYLWMPRAGGAYKVIEPSQRECTRALQAARRRGHPAHSVSAPRGPGRFSSRCMYEGQAYE